MLHSAIKIEEEDEEPYSKLNKIKFSDIFFEQNLSKARGIPRQCRMVLWVEFD